MLRLRDQRAQSEFRDLVRHATVLEFGPQALDGGLGRSELGDLMADVIEVVTGQFDARHAASVAEAPSRNATQIICDREA